MIWSVFFAASVAVFIMAAAGALVLGKVRPQKWKMVDPIHLLIAGVFLSAAILTYPLYQGAIGGATGIFGAVFLSLHDTLQFFTVDSGFDALRESTAQLPSGLRDAYCFFGAFLQLLAPLLTFGFLLSFFKNISAYRKYLAHYFAEVYVFSERNEKSMTLAESIRERDKKALLVFTDVFDENDERSYESGQRAAAIDAVCFKKDILAVNFSWHSKRGQMCFFVMGRDENENIDQTLKLIARYGDRENTRLFLFSTSVSSELMLNTAEKGKMKVRRIDEIQSLINRTLYDRGGKIFESAWDAGGEKVISAVIVGMGQYGERMLRALSWYCQMDGYRLEMDAFDRDPLAEDRFTALCPELMSEAHNGKFEEGEARYRLAIHPGIAGDTQSFLEAVGRIKHPTYVFVALGDDNENLTMAVRLRILFERLGVDPVIQTIVYNTEEKLALQDVKNSRGQAYRIDCIGDIRSSYSEKVIIGSELEADALRRHFTYFDHSATECDPVALQAAREAHEADFWEKEYCYSSSVASAIHGKARIACGIPGAEKTDEERNPEEQEIIRSLEHRRWNAYMRSQGYIYSGSREKTSRNDLAMMHNDLVNYEILTEADRRKDG